jgi:hypothetical protein
MLGFPRNSLVLTELQDRFFQAIALVLHAVHQTLGPHELSRKQREPKKNDKPPGAGREKHNDTYQEKGKPGKNSEKAANLLDRPKEHGSSGGRRRRESLF